MSVTYRKAGMPAGLSSAMDKIRGDYDMSRENRFIRRRTNIPYQGGSADWHYRSEFHYYRDIEKARDMDRNDAIIGQTVDRAVANIVQDGFTLDPRTGDKKLDADLKQRWMAWANDPETCDITGEFCFHDFETQVCRDSLVDGDCVDLGLTVGSLQHLEGHTIKTTTRMDNTVLGVTKSPVGKRLTYWVQADPIESYKDATERAKPLKVRNAQGRRVLFHTYNPKRMSQTRGVTAFAPVFALAGMFEDIQFAKLVQQQVVSCFAVFREREYIPDLPGGENAGYGNSETETSDSGETRYIENLAPGIELTGRPGEKLHGFSPSVPNAEYFDHVRLMLQMIGVNLGLPLCLVLMDGSETNFSGWRGAVDEARKGFRANQRNLCKRFHEPVYRWKLSQWMAQDAALRAASKKPRVDLFGHKWNAPTWSYIEPVKDAQGDALRLEKGLTSPRRLHSERGRDWDDVTAETIEDNSLAIVRAKKQAASINKRYPDETPVHWRELISLPSPGVVVPPQPQGKPEDEDDDDE